MKSKGDAREGQFAGFGTSAVSPRARHHSEALKRELCDAIERAILRRQWTQERAAANMRVSRANLSRVANKKIECLTVSQLFRYLKKVCPDFRVMISIDSSLTGHVRDGFFGE